MLAEIALEAVRQLRLVGLDRTLVEVDRAQKGPPRSLAATVSAFSNGDGGLILLGVDSSRGFVAVPTDAPALLASLTEVCRKKVVPAVLVEAETVPLEGTLIVAAAIPPGDRKKRPYYIRSRRRWGASYRRTPKGNRRITEDERFEILSENAKEPTQETAPSTASRVVAEMLFRVLSGT